VNQQERRASGQGIGESSQLDVTDVGMHAGLSSWSSKNDLVKLEQVQGVLLWSWLYHLDDSALFVEALIVLAQM